MLKLVNDSVTTKEHKFLSQLTALQKAGVLSNPEQPNLKAEVPKPLKSNVGSKGVTRDIK